MTFLCSIGTTPYKAWHKCKPELSHLHEIGCRAFVLLQDRHNPKIYVQSFECMLISYASNAKAYRLYHCDTSRIIQSYHVDFIESHNGIASPLFPGHITSTNHPPLATHPPQVSIEDEDDIDAPHVADSSLPLAPILADENEPSVTSSSSPVVSSSTTPAPEHITALPPPDTAPANALPPALAETSTQQSARIQAPSYWKSLTDSVWFLSHMDHAIAKSCEAALYLKELRKTAHDNRHRAVLEVCKAVADPNPHFTCRECRLP